MPRSFTTPFLDTKPRVPSPQVFPAEKRFSVLFFSPPRAGASDDSQKSCPPFPPPPRTYFEPLPAGPRRGLPRLARMCSRKWCRTCPRTCGSPPALKNRLFHFRRRPASKKRNDNCRPVPPQTMKSACLVLRNLRAAPAGHLPRPPPSRPKSAKISLVQERRHGNTLRPRRPDHGQRVPPQSDVAPKLTLHGSPRTLERMLNRPHAPTGGWFKVLTIYCVHSCRKSASSMCLFVLNIYSLLGFFFCRSISAGF